MNAVTVFAISVGALCAAAGLAADPNVPPGRRLSDPIEQERAESEEQYVLLNARVQNLLETQDLLLRHQALLLQNLEELEKKLEQVEAAQREALANFVTRAELKHLVEKLEEIDQKRLADNDLVLDKIKELARTPPEVKVVVPAPAAIAAGSEKVQVYKVQPGDTLTRIVAA